MGPEFLRVGGKDVTLLGSFAGAWSALTGMLPSLACPVDYGFLRPFGLHFRIGARASGLGALAAALSLFLSFPWLRLSGRFLHCWRNPRLNRWQRRLLLS